MKLTVIFTDPMPLICQQLPVTYRRVTLNLTNEQAKALAPRHVGQSGNKEVFEDISICFIEKDGGQ